MHSGNAKVEKFSVIIAAAGFGKRMETTEKKQFLEKDSKPLYMSSVMIADQCELVDEIIIVTSAEDINLVKKHCEKFGIKKLKNIVAGGKERQDSIWSGLKNIESGIVAVQDGARPFMRKSYLCDGYQKLLDDKTLDGIVVGVKVKDTIKNIDKCGIIIDTPPRENLVAVQTPQIFKYDILFRAYKKAFEENFYGTDDSSLVERIGGKVEILFGDYDNIKITTPDDLKYL
ncbi:MAG: 2-C-methyl-D-erythritol 4-phosphate cytidylyltransferase [Fusobacteriaceae bacterium]